MVLEFAIRMYTLSVYRRVRKVCLCFFCLQRFCFFVAVDLKSAPGAIYQGEPKQGKPGVTLTISDDDLLAMAAGKLDGQKVS